MEKMGAVHFTTVTIPCEPDTANKHIESHIFMNFIPVLTTLCMLALKFIELFWSVFYECFQSFCMLRIMG